MKKAKLLKSEGNLAVRLPKSWGRGGELVTLSKQGDSIIITPENNTFLSRAEKFRKNGVIEAKRPKQLTTPPAKKL